MDRKGQAEVLQISLLFEIIAAVVIASFLIYAAMSYNMVTNFNANYLTKDLSFLLNTVYSAPGSVEITYPLSEQYRVDIEVNQIEVSHTPSILLDPFNKDSALFISNSIGSVPQIKRNQEKEEGKT